MRGLRLQLVGTIGAVLFALCGSLGAILYGSIDANAQAQIFKATPRPATFYSCFVEAVTVMTQCQAAPAAGFRNYVTSVTVSNEAATVQTLDVVFGTGSNCATSPTALTHKIQLGTLATTSSPITPSIRFNPPLVPTAANAICVRPTAATAFGATITGYIAP